MSTRWKFSQGWAAGQQAILVGTLLLGFCQSSLAQIVPDNTLGSESSTVAPDINIQEVISGSSAVAEGIRIEGGAIRGANLFHSFSQFSIGSGRGAYFANPAGIQNILSRVTGANRSEILGRLGVLGNANLFLMNPNGIVFGSAASLDVKGAFLATTANAIKLGDTGLFSASQPTTSNLLSVSPSALWFNAVAASPIVNRSQAQSLINQLNSNNGVPGLQVQPSRTLALVGGDVLLEGGNLTAAGGRIELGSVAGVGEVSLSQSENSLVLGYDAINNFGNIKLSNRAFVDASGAGGGDIQIRGARLEMTQSSDIWADTLGAGNGKQVLVGTSEVVLDGKSALNANAIGTGTGGDVRIETGRLLVQGGAGVSATTYGSGKSGSLLINAANSIEVIGTSADGQLPSSLNAQSTETGDAGELRIDTQRLLVQGGAQVSTSTFGLGKGGSLLINAADSVELIGSSADGQIRGGLFAGSQGSGNVRINTQRLRVSAGAVVTINTEDQGKGGSLLINAADSVEIIGTSADSQLLSGLFAGGRGSGDAGDIRIDTKRLIVRDGALIAADTRGTGRGGSLLINAADSVEIIGVSADGRTPSALNLISGRAAGGDAGRLRIDTQRLRVQGGAQVTASTESAGKGGSLLINAAESVEIIGTFDNGRIDSGLFTQSRSIGDAGDLTIDTGRLRVQDGAVVSASTFSSGKGGSLRVRATDLVELSGTAAGVSGGLFTASNGSGNAGEVLQIDTGRLRVQDGAVISSRSIRTGKAGNIAITVRDTLEANNGTIQTNTSRSAGGAITIEAKAIRLFDNSDIISNVASGEGGGGNIDLKARSILAFGDSDILAFSRNGRGGNITLDTRAFFSENYRPAPPGTNLLTLNNNDRVDINATGTVSGIITLPDVSFIQNSLTELPDTQINTDTLLANSCIVRRNQPTQGSFTITGTGGLPQRPREAQASSFPTVEIETLPEREPTSYRVWQKGDAIVEPQGVYRLPNGKLVLSRNCL
ncbi:filamentous hemagglutinin N-terminal domain-containing protein [Phormidesmis sp. 146-35]